MRSIAAIVPITGLDRHPGWETTWRTLMDVTGMGAGAGTRTEEVCQAVLKDLLARAHRTRSRHRGMTPRVPPLTGSAASGLHALDVRDVDAPTLGPGPRLNIAGQYASQRIDESMARTDDVEDHPDCQP